MSVKPLPDNRGFTVLIQQNSGYQGLIDTKPYPNNHISGELDKNKKSSFLIKTQNSLQNVKTIIY